MNIYAIWMAVSLCLYILIGMIISRKVKNADDFYVAGRHAPVLLISGSMIASYVSTGLFMGDAAEAFSGIFSPIIILATMQVAGYLFGAVYFGRYLRRSNVYTIPEFFEKRFDSKRLKKLAVITSIVTMIVYLLSIMQGIGTLAHVVTGIDYRVCIVAAVTTFAVVSILSGARGVLITDTIMFGLFTVALLVATVYITKGPSGWLDVVEKLAHSEKPDLLSWGGVKDYLYASDIENVIWGFMYGIVWLAVCMVGPWQSSRYLMAKNEHTIIRSALFTAAGVFILEVLVSISAVAINTYSPDLKDSSHVMIWASMNILPTFLGVLLLTGVLAAGISSGTTFLSIIGSTFANDIFKNKAEDTKYSIRIGRLTMIGVSVIVLILAIYNPPQIFWIMYFGGAIIASSWLPVTVAAIMCPKLSADAAFWGMLIGFIGCFAMKMISVLGHITLPLYLDPTITGIILSTITLICVSKITKPKPNLIDIHSDLFVIPNSELVAKDEAVTVRHLKGFIWLGLFVTVVLLAVWAIPYALTK